MSSRHAGHARSAGLALSVLASISLGAHIQASESTFTLADEAVDAAARSVNAIPIELGRSAQGRPLRGVVVTDAHVTPTAKARVLIIAGQHGNESNACLAVSRLAAEWASCPTFDGLRRRSVAVFVPAVNPDGLALGIRFDSTGGDLNRDWGRFSRPETRAVAEFVTRWKPHVLIDAHEWSDTRLNEPDSVELATGCASLELLHTTRRVRAASLDEGFAAIDSRPGCSTALFHRHFARNGYVAYLVETSARTPAAEKRRLYRAAITALAESAVEQRERIEACSESGGEHTLPAHVTARRDNAPTSDGESRQRAALTMGAWVCSGVCWMLAGARTRRAPTRWLRGLRRCSASDVGLIYTPRGPLPDLTSRSWVNRRTRSGHRVSGRAAV